ncbi:hypothetical protein CA13_09450 [Planctomycetes bacterium CA13]|uniref:Uncharacterized protein n=1 Tax=Novipirellula herctigrandis TaxID=2527986 RepID=A0A5C5YY18_9BACT|nr:hypothetical protein CA13_09450 [Planctomycetes bacterium CA13]
MVNSNPYATPNDANGNVPTTTNRARWSTSGFMVSVTFALLYSVVLAMSLYEYANAANGYPTADYVRHGIASALFLAICLSAARGFWNGHTYARWLLVVSPVLLIIFVLPGLNAVLNYVANIVS